MVWLASSESRHLGRAGRAGFRRRRVARSAPPVRVRLELLLGCGPASTASVTIRIGLALIGVAGRGGHLVALGRVTRCLGRQGQVVDLVVAGLVTLRSVLSSVDDSPAISSASSVGKAEPVLRGPRRRVVRGDHRRRRPRTRRRPGRRLVRRAPPSADRPRRALR